MYVITLIGFELWVKQFGAHGEVTWTNKETEADRYLTKQGAKDLCRAYELPFDDYVILKV